jgi:hypothetical protein
MTSGSDSKFWCFSDSVTFWRFLALLLLSLELLLFLSGRGEGSCASPPPAVPHAASLQTLYHPSGAPRSPGDTPTCAVAAAPSFWSLGVTVGTDKVTLPPQIIPQSHSYQFAYERYLRPRRCDELAFLEIGLGCGMPYKDGSSGAYARTTEGHSIPLWLAYLPRARINVFEYSADCAHAFFNNDPLGLGDDFKRRARLFTGDQSKEEDLHSAMKEMGPQDVIIDDGGHSVMQQQTSLRVLLHYLKPGGVCAWRGARPARTFSCATVRPPPARSPHPSQLQPPTHEQTSSRTSSPASAGRTLTGTTR